MAHGLVQYIAILRKVKTSALRYCYLNASRTRLSVPQGMYARRKFVNLFHNLDSCSTKIVYNTKINVCFGELLQYFNTSNDFLKQLELSFLIIRVSQENLAGGIVVINGYPFCEKTSG